MVAFCLLRNGKNTSVRIRGLVGLHVGFANAKYLESQATGLVKLQETHVGSEDHISNLNCSS